ncbi:hypothetical protein BD626DRAFT_477638 [Schizophyllum amplum]|uniref:Uncharacterized protein n=1 Tax=Schizophyllum amplum TaxID=97359 RepID=A0A550D0C3_9AGAR|nr:hypothetical protein BD626DRAFT_477638 [Auriculariopsis ampla]
MHVIADDPSTLFPYFQAASTATEDLRLTVTGPDCPIALMNLFIRCGWWLDFSESSCRE